ncbi:ABC transporter permease [Streptomyces sp. NBC_00582]|uniref:ABC transporter permease n=1 Tax=Streptomyces sp. NBC_00582 TaxID=2975783 RepID=UPI0010E6A31B|nr:ABC transporter permease [Streptomyces sp. NBC_00582]WUB59230.1 ABC transporter permease [Streptomyces sp. NBC_00582]
MKSSDPVRSSAPAAAGVPRLLEPLGRTAVLGLREYLVEYPPSILLATVLPRALLQTAFLVLLGRAAGGHTGAVGAAIGASAYAMVNATALKGPDVLINERVQGTLYHLRMTDLPVAGLVAARWVAYTAEGFMASLLSVPVAALISGDPGLTTRLVAALPLYLLMALTTSCFGFAVAVVAVARRADVFLTNLGAYLILASGGVLSLQPDGVAGLVGSVLPLTHGVAALRAWTDGSNPLPQAAAEALTGLVWALLALAGITWQARRARRSGSDFLM